jgi:hypothetical protein
MRLYGGGGSHDIVNDTTFCHLKILAVGDSIVAYHTSHLFCCPLAPAATRLLLIGFFVLANPIGPKAGQGRAGQGRAGLGMTCRQSARAVEWRNTKKEEDIKTSRTCARCGFVSIALQRSKAHD